MLYDSPNKIIPILGGKNQQKREKEEKDKRKNKKRYALFALLLIYVTFNVVKR